MSGRTLVTGATGLVGRAIVAHLRADGADVVGLVRKPGTDLGGADTAVGDLTDRGSLVAAMQGCTQLLLITPPIQGQLAMGRTALAAAVEAGVHRVVHISTSDASVDSPVPWAAAPAQIDAQLQSGPATWTILKPSAFDGDVLAAKGLLKRGLLIQCSGDGTVAWVDPADVASCAAHVLTTDGHAGREYVLTGPEALSYRGVAEVLTGVRGSTVRFLDLPGPVLRVLLRLGGTSAWQADGLIAQFADVIKHGKTDGATPTREVAALLGRPPRSLEDYLIAHRDEL